MSELGVVCACGSSREATHNYVVVIAESLVGGVGGGGGGGGGAGRQSCVWWSRHPGCCGGLDGASGSASADGRNGREISSHST